MYGPREAKRQRRHTELFVPAENVRDQRLSSDTHYRGIGVRIATKIKLEEESGAQFKTQKLQLEEVVRTYSLPLLSPWTSICTSRSAQHWRNACQKSHTTSYLSYASNAFNNRPQPIPLVVHCSCISRSAMCTKEELQGDGTTIQFCQKHHYQRSCGR